MNAPACERITLADLTDYAARGLPENEATAFEDHLFACADCGARAAEFEALVRAVGAAARSADVGGFVTDEVLNRLSRDGVRVRTFALSPGAIVPCAVWEGDELMALRLRADFGDAREVTMTQSVAGSEVVRVTTEVGPGALAELIFAQPAALVRQLPAVEVEILLLVRAADGERRIGSYTLVHGGSLHR